jgi:predicted secreted hydrolase
MRPVIRILAASGAFLIGMGAPGLEARASGSWEASAFERAEGRREWRFPRDHGQHPRFRLEWWYYTGLLRTRGGREFGFQVTFFRRGLNTGQKPGKSAWHVGSLYLAHAALSDIQARTLNQSARVGRDSLGMSGAAADRLHVWLSTWRASPAGDGPHDAQLTIDADAFSLRLRLTAEKPPVLHGEEGLDRKGPEAGQASWYYSIPRLSVWGTVTRGKEAWDVEGVAWMDHEFGTSQLGVDLAGWDWFSVRLSNGYDLMLYRLRHKNGSTDAASHGTLVTPDGRGIPLRISPATVLEPVRFWKSPHTGARYPVAWHISLPEHGLMLEIAPRFDAQELRLEHGMPIAYWEGAISAQGMQGQSPVRGEGYLELTGYTGTLTEAFR